MIELRNNDTSVPLSSITPLDYTYFYELVISLLSIEAKHCVSYFAHPEKDGWLCICCIADDETEKIMVLAHKVKKTRSKTIPALSAKHPALHSYEREMHENYGIPFANHPWLKPLRFPQGAADENSTIQRYPFYSLTGEGTHEVGVGPIHAGITEPGYFRFCCNGEKVLHLESVLGFQHRGIEKLLLKKTHPLQQSVIAESIAGDTTIGHSLAYAMLAESLSDTKISARLSMERGMALEIERVAMHIADTSAMCADTAYQLGQVACEALRTITINTLQAWCGNRFGKGLIRPGGTYYTAYHETLNQIATALNDVKKRYRDISDCIFTLPGMLSRFEGVGALTHKQALQLGMVGLTARASGVRRDIRSTHAFMSYKTHAFNPNIMENGDIHARMMLRKIEVEQSIDLILSLADKLAALSILTSESTPGYQLQYQPESLAISLVEGWRGEICHMAVTNEKGEISQYKIKDPSLHNWMGLSIAMRNQQISDFPICNKSFNLSYCGHDL
ncbi:MAG: NADH-quinone oxidoreductase subunit C [Prevotellaceae bacterium]|jgi:Ni,Fe-hydrogenase III large subunit|nr:NADH-quinone oxidoreductase subunit C [Prevotellaceae bacterium]